MESFDSLFKKQNMGQVILLILFIIYLLAGYKTPELLARGIDTIIGKIVVVVVAILLFCKCNPILGVLGFVVAYVLIRRSEMKTGTYALERYMPTEEKKASNLTAFNQFPYTLEQEMVSKMAPIEHTVYEPSSFVPLLDNTHDALPV
jgi:hypothetical protein